jgi:lantibiotic biosynthesis protein
MHNRLAAGMGASESLAVRCELAALSLVRAVDTSSMLTNPGLSGGLAGVSLAQAVVGLHHRDQQVLESSGRTFRQAQAALHSQSSTIGLHAGFTGLAWLGHKMSRHGLLELPEDFTDEIDDTLFAYLRSSVHSANYPPYELMSGLAGIGVYARAHPDIVVGDALMDLVVTLLEASAERDGSRITWLTKPELHDDLYGLDPSTSGSYNLGVAHGVPGLLGFLVDASLDARYSARCLPILQAGVEWLVAQAYGAEHSYRYSYTVCETPLPQPSRVAWCYGDLGVATILARAGDALQYPEAIELARSMAYEVATRDRALSGVVDVSLCHGTAGNGLLLHILHRRFGHGELAVAADAWLEDTIALVERDQAEFGSVRSWKLVASRPRRFAFVRDFSLLEGAAGVGLCLLMRAGSQYSFWQELFALGVGERRNSQRDTLVPEIR